MNLIPYNFKRHVELLIHKKNARNQGKTLENRAEFLELLDYNTAVERHIFWQDRFEVASLIETFLNKEINAEEFHDSVFGLRRTPIEKRDNFLSRLVSGEIKEFFPNKESDKFKGFLSALYFECEYLEMNWDEEAFYNSIQDGFLKFQKVLNEE